MAAQKFIYGIAKVELGEPTGLATMPEILAQFSETVKGSFTLAETEPETVDAETEESAAPLFSITSKEGVLEGNWKTFDYTPAMLEKVKGGDGHTTATKWQAPATTTNIEQALKLTTVAGPILNVYKAKLTARFTGVISKTGFSEIEVKFKALAPAAGLSPYDWDEVN